MKIKSVKITGFRAFEKEENSTFDFTSNGEIMDFASIYAPNGFGKYDKIKEPLYINKSIVNRCS